MKTVLISIFAFICVMGAHTALGSEASRLRTIIKKRDHEIRELRKEIDLLHRQLAEEQPTQASKLAMRSDRAASIAPSSPEGSFLEHKVGSGDTLSGLAHKHGSSVDAIKEINGLTSHIIRLGQKLKIPTVSESFQSAPVPRKQLASASQSAPTISPPTSSYSVKAGDTFHSIARRQSCSVEALRELNPDIDPRRLRIGQEISLPGSSPVSAPAAAKSSEEQFVKLEKNLSSPVTEISTPPRKRVVEVELTEEMTFEAFANKQGMSMARLNELNGHKLRADELLAATSIFLVEK